MASSKDPQLAQVKLHPAVIVVGCLLVSLLARRTWQLNLGPGILAVFRYLGIALQITGVGVLLMSYRSMAAARTTIDPREHSSKVVTSGLYAYSRNPIYLGWFLLIAGIGFRNASLLVLVVAVTMVLLLYWAVIVEGRLLREEIRRRVPTL